MNTGMRKKYFPSHRYKESKRKLLRIFIKIQDKSRVLISQGPGISGRLYIHCIPASFAFLNVEEDRFVFKDVFNYFRNMEEDFFPAAFHPDKAKTFVMVEEFYNAFVHFFF